MRLSIPLLLKWLDSKPAVTEIAHYFKGSGNGSVQNGIASAIRQAFAMGVNVGKAVSVRK